MANNRRGVVVGASSLVGRELIEDLGTTGWDLRLAETANASGKFVAGADEALITQPLTPDIFDGRDVAFFAADSKTARAHWKEAKAAGAVVIDLTGSLEAEPDAVVRCPWIENAAAAPRKAAIVIPAHPAAVMLGLIASRLRSAFADVRVAATLLEPASQQGSAGLDEMHQQTVSLLGLHSLQQDVYDSQVAFNLRISLGEEAKLNLGEIAATIRRHMKAISGDAIAASVALQLVQAPVFHGYTMSIYVQLPESADAAAVRSALHDGLIAVANPGEDAPSNQSVMQEPGIAIALTEDAGRPPHARSYWLWAATDNLKLAAKQAVACAEEVVAARGESLKG